MRALSHFIVSYCIWVRASSLKVPKWLQLTVTVLSFYYSIIYLLTNDMILSKIWHFHSLSFPLLGKCWHWIKTRQNAEIESVTWVLLQYQQCDVIIMVLWLHCKVQKKAGVCPKHLNIKGIFGPQISIFFFWILFYF